VFYARDGQNTTKKRDLMALPRGHYVADDSIDPYLRLVVATVLEALHDLERVKRPTADRYTRADAEDAEAFLRDGWVWNVDGELTQLLTEIIDKAKA